MLSRIAIAIVFLATVAPAANGQRVFRASSIDIEQNERIDSLEAKVGRIEASVNKLVSAVEAKQIAKPATVVSEPVRVIQPAISSDTIPVSTQSPEPRLSRSRYSQAELVSIVQQAYPSGDWTRYADVSPRSAVWSHLQDPNHQFSAEQVQGLPQNIALGLHGLHHAGKIRATRIGQPQTMTATVYAEPQPQPVVMQSYPQPVAAPVYSQPIIQQSGGGCPNGQCPAPSYSQPVRRSFGIFRR